MADSIYPEAIDGYSQLPLIVDNVTEVNAVSVNRLRSAIVNVESTLGVNPQGTFDTVVERLDSLDMDSSAEVRTITSSDSILSTDRILLIDATAGDIVLTLPDATGAVKMFDIKKIDSTSNTVTINTSLSQTVDGESGIQIVYQYDSYSLVSNMENWFII